MGDSSDQKVRAGFERKRIILPSSFLRTIRGKLNLGPPLTGTLLVLLWIWFFFEITLFHMSVASGSTQLWEDIFILSSDSLHYHWTWITSILTHNSIIHLLANSIALWSFGRYVERRGGQYLFLVTFVLSALVASYGQIMVSVASGGSLSLVGSSGGIAGLIGLAAVLVPELRVYFLFTIPMKLFGAVVFFVCVSIAVIVTNGPGAFGVANTAHVAGFFTGLATGLGASKRKIPVHFNQLVTGRKIEKYPRQNEHEE